MFELSDLTAAGSFIAASWGPALIGATTIFGGLVVATTFSKDALGRIEDGIRTLVDDWERRRAGSSEDEDEITAAPEPDASATQWLKYATEQEPESEREFVSAPETTSPTLAAPTEAADPASTSADLHAADGDQILGRFCRMDTASTADGLEFTMEVPGLKETDLEISLVGDTIVIVGQMQLDRGDKTYRVVEREFGPFSRFIKVSEGVAVHRIQATLDRGLLTVFVPNPTVQVGKIIAVNSTVRRIADGADLFELRIDLPGVDESDVDLVVSDGVLTISRGRGQQPPGADNAVAPRLLQSMELPAGVDAGRIRAVLAKGVLTVTLPVAAAHRQRTIPLESVREAPGPKPRTSGAEAPAFAQAATTRQSEAPVGSQGDPLFDFWTAGEILAGRSVHLGESVDRRF